MSTNEQVYSIFILKSSKNILSQAEVYLRNRGWQVASGVALREAIAYVIQKQPQYILLSSDHPNKKIKILPQLLAQAFPVKVIMFAEQQSTTSVRALTALNFQWSLFPPVSGPSIERYIKKIEHNSEKAVSGSIEKSENILSTKNSDVSKSDSNKTLSQLMSQLGDDAPGDSGPAYMPTQSVGQGPAYMPDHSAKGGPAYMPDHSGSGGAAYMPNHYQGGAEPQGAGAYFPPQLQKNEDESFEDWAERLKQEAIANPAAFSNPENSEQSFLPPDLQKNENESFDDWADRIKKQAVKDPVYFSETMKTNFASQFSSSPRQEKASPVMEFGEAQKAQRNKDTLFIQGAKAALDESVKVSGYSKERADEKIQDTSNVACITVDSPRFSGYLVCALGKDRKIDKNLISTIQKKLFAFLKSNGEDIKDDDAMKMKLEQVNFESWSLAQAEFLKKSIHEGDEIAIAFFPTKDTNVDLEDSASEKMLQMNIKDLKADTPLEFDLYVYMPENNKYLLYTPEGMVFYGDQKNRLMEKGVTNMHLRKDSVHSVKKYKAQNFLNEKIQAFKKQKASN